MPGPQALPSLWLAAFTPVILALGGPEALEETARAIVDVGRWWP